MSLHSVFGSSPPPGSYTMYSDSPPWIKLGTTFYMSSPPAGSQIVGGRQWIPAGTGSGSLTMELRLLVKNGVNDLLTAPVQSKVVNWTGDTKWVEATFDVPQDVPASSMRWMISYRMGLDGRYISSLDARPSPGNPIKSDTSDLYLSDFLYPTAPAGPVHGRQFTVGGDPVVFSAADTGGYGTDTIVSIPDAPGNVPPVARAGADRTAPIGSLVTLDGSTSTDAEGPISSFAWAQIAGPSVVLAGSGPTRTYTPSVEGVRTFRLTVTDNSGATSQDTVVVTTPAPEDDSPVSIGSGINLPLNRKLTKAFIAFNPVTVVLTPRARVKKPAGGFGWQEGTARDPQVMTVIEQTGLSGQPKPLRTVDGVERVVEFELLGAYGATIARDDVFSYQGKDWEVIDLYHDNGYEVRALVSARG